MASEDPLPRSQCDCWQAARPCWLVARDVVLCRVGCFSGQLTAWPLTSLRARRAGRQSLGSLSWQLHLIPFAIFSLFEARHQVEPALREGGCQGWDCLGAGSLGPSQRLPVCVQPTAPVVHVPHTYKTHCPQDPSTMASAQSPEGRHPDGLQVWVRVPGCSCLSAAPGVPFVSVCRPELKTSYQPLPRTVVPRWDRHRVTTVDAPQKGGERESVKESQARSSSVIQPGKCWKSLHWV